MPCWSELNTGRPNWSDSRLGWLWSAMFHHHAILLSQSCQFPISPSRTMQKMQQPKSKSTQPSYPTRWAAMYYNSLRQNATRQAGHCGDQNWLESHFYWFGRITRLYKPDNFIKRPRSRLVLEISLYARCTILCPKRKPEHGLDSKVAKYGRTFQCLPFWLHFVLFYSIRNSPNASLVIGFGGIDWDVGPGRRRLPDSEAEIDVDDASNVPSEREEGDIVARWL